MVCFGDFLSQPPPSSVLFRLRLWMILRCGVADPFTRLASLLADLSIISLVCDLKSCLGVTTAEPYGLLKLVDTCLLGISGDSVGLLVSQLNLLRAGCGLLNPLPACITVLISDVF